MPSKAHMLAQVGVALQAEFTGMAGHRRVHSHPLALAWAGGDDPAELVPEHERLAQSCIANTGFAEPMQVRATDADGLHTQQSLARAGLRLRFIVQAYIVGTVQANDLHVRYKPFAR